MGLGAGAESACAVSDAATKARNANPTSATLIPCARRLRAKIRPAPNASRTATGSDGSDAATRSRSPRATAIPKTDGALLPTAVASVSATATVKVPVRISRSAPEVTVKITSCLPPFAAHAASRLYVPSGFAIALSDPPGVSASITASRTVSLLAKRSRNSVSLPLRNTPMSSNKVDDASIRGAMVLETGVGGAPWSWPSCANAVFHGTTGRKITDTRTTATRKHKALHFIMNMRVIQP